MAWSQIEAQRSGVGIIERRKENGTAISNAVFHRSEMDSGGAEKEGFTLSGHKLLIPPNIKQKHSRAMLLFYGLETRNVHLDDIMETIDD